jgi:hypothetical protein
MPDNRPSTRRAYNFIAEDRMSDRNHDDTRPSVTWSASISPVHAERLNMEVSLLDDINPVEVG